MTLQQDLVEKVERLVIPRLLLERDGVPGIEARLIGVDLVVLAVGKPFVEDLLGQPEAMRARRCLVHVGYRRTDHGFVATGYRSFVRTFPRLPVVGSTVEEQ